MKNKAIKLLFVVMLLGQTLTSLGQGSVTWDATTRRVRVPNGFWSSNAVPISEALTALGWNNPSSNTVTFLPGGLILQPDGIWDANVSGIAAALEAFGWSAGFTPTTHSIELRFLSTNNAVLGRVLKFDGTNIVFGTDEGTVTVDDQPVTTIRSGTNIVFTTVGNEAIPDIATNLTAETLNVQTITAESVQVQPEPYGPGWSGSDEASSKGDLYTKIESLGVWTLHNITLACTADSTGHTISVAKVGANYVLSVTQDAASMPASAPTSISLTAADSTTHSVTVSKIGTNYVLNIAQ